jgi:hypothetical protein
VIFRAAPLIFLGDRSPGTVAATNPLDEGGALRVPKKASLNGLEPFARLIIWSLAPSAWMRFASIPTRGRKGAWHRVGGGWFASTWAGRSRCQAPGSCLARRLLASSRVLDRCLAPGWHRESGRDSLAFRLRDGNWCLAPGWQQFASIRPRFKGAWHEWHSWYDWLLPADGRPLPMRANQCWRLADLTKHACQFAAIRL